MPMLSLQRDGFTAEQVAEALHAPWGTQIVDFRYDLLDRSLAYKRTLTTVQSGSVSHDALGDIKRKAQFSLKDDGTIDFLSDRIQPWALLYVPPGTKGAAGGWATFPLGVFLLSTPEKVYSRSPVPTREVEAYDQCLVLQNATVDAYLITAGTKYTDAIRTILASAGITRVNITESSKTLPVDREWDAGTSKLAIINDLLKALNYYSLWFDGEGYAMCVPYSLPADAPSEYTYAEDARSVIVTDDLRLKQDLFSIPNEWVFTTVAQSGSTSLRSVYRNENPASPLSIVNRGMTITDRREVEAADQATLDALVKRAAEEASQVYETVTWQSWILPHHNHMDNYTLNSSRLGGAAKYREVQWSMELKSGGRMSHTCRRQVAF